MQLRDLRNDDRYLGLPAEERAKVLQRLAAEDEDFMALPDVEKAKALTYLATLQIPAIQDTPEQVHAKYLEAQKNAKGFNPTPMEGVAQTASNVAGKVVRNLPVIGSMVNSGLLTGQDVVDVAAGGSGLMRGGLNQVSDGLGDKMFPTSAANKDSVARTLGSLADPVGWSIGGGVSKAIPYAPVLGKGLMGGLKALGINATSGGITGGAIGALSEDSTAKEGAVSGMVLGVALPAAIGTGQYIGKTIGQIADLITPGGAKRISDRYVNLIVGENNKDELAKALKEAPELVAGSKPTVAESVAHLPSGSPLQQGQNLVAKEPGGISAQFGSRVAQQQAAREAQLGFAGTEQQIKDAIAERTAAVEPLYKAVETSTAKVRSSPVLTMVNDIFNKNVNKTAITTPLQKIRDKLILKTDTGTRIESNPQNLKSLSDEISSMMGSKTPGGQNEFDVKVLAQIKELLDKQIGKAEPAYKVALDTFIEKSKPINKMQLGARLKEVLTNPSGIETPGTYLRALDNEKKLLKDATGFGRSSIEDILTPEELKQVHQVAADLERKVASNNPLQKTDLRGGVNVASESTITLPQLLSRPAMIANYAVKGLGKNIEPEIDRYLTSLYLNPKEMGKVLSRVDPNQRAKVYEAIQTYGKASLLSAQGQK